ncbi:hypothetical protein J2W76_002317 [Methylorubrum zatmanii]|nr:hypothetical protein [Methylorubrum zatmanii]MCP1554315.1 hypothetical protein [Methylorubrum extorquens]MCP1579374.1 hypothetical protein [Methylorubrum extorquens]
MMQGSALHPRKDVSLRKLDDRYAPVRARISLR